jgi:hypothetical protein
MEEQGTDSDPIAELHRAGWSVGVVALASLDGSGRVVWQVDVRNGENVIRSAGETEAEAWRGALDQAWVVVVAGRLATRTVPLWVAL